LAEHLVGLVGAAVKQILALEVETRPPAEIATKGQRSRPPGIGGEQPVQLGAEGEILRRVEDRRLELLDRRNEYLRHIGAAISAEASAQAHAASPRTGSRSASKKAWSLPESLRPGAIS